MDKPDINNCPIRKTFRILGNKWAYIVILQLQEVKRYGEIKKNIPDISEKVLIDKLRLLQKYKFIKRKDYKQVPPKVEYSLTELGREALELKPILLKIGMKLN